MFPLIFGVDRVIKLDPTAQIAPENVFPSFGFAHLAAPGRWVAAWGRSSREVTFRAWRSGIFDAKVLQPRGARCGGRGARSTLPYPRGTQKLLGDGPGWFPDLAARAMRVAVRGFDVFMTHSSFLTRFWSRMPRFIEICLEYHRNPTFNMKTFKTHEKTSKLHKNKLGFRLDDRSFLRTTRTYQIPPNLNRCLSSSDKTIDTKQKHMKEVTYTKLVNLNVLREITDSYLPQFQTSRLTSTRKSMVLNSKSTTLCKRIHTSSC